MSEAKKIATRETYGKTLVELGAEMPNLVVLDADLAGATKTGVFKKAYPDRHIDCGIAEGNMMSIAAGLAASGMVPFASTFAMFAAGRAFEQVRNSIGYPHLNVKIGATHAGISVGEDGASHQCLEDLALMRTIPGMVVMCPADDTEARKAIRAAVEHEGPVYIRFGRAPVPVVFDDDYDFQIGKGSIIREGQAPGRGADREDRLQDRQGRDSGRAQHHRRPGRSSGRVPRREVPYQDVQDRRARQIRRVRIRRSAAPQV